MPSGPHVEPNTESIEAAKSAGLRYVSDEQPGIRRQRAGAGFRYQREDGRAVSDPRTLARIRRLAIPPAWTEVWICPREDGHIQATGRDARGRKQYRYHPDWRAVRDETKYERMIAFAEALPEIRRRVSRDLRRPGLGREKVLGTMVRLLETTLVRVGNEEYAKENGSIGLSTMRDRNARINGTTIHFSFTGKSGRRHHIDLRDPRLAAIVRRTQDLPGQELFQYVDHDGRRQKISSEDVNEYLRTVAGGEFSAKDFRTWAGTVLAAIALAALAPSSTKTQAKKNIVRAVEHVAQRLGNTPAVCRKCYIHPAILEGYLRGSTIRTVRAKTEEALAPGLSPDLSQAERAVLVHLRAQLRRPRRSLVEILRRSVERARRRPRRHETGGGARAAARSRTHRARPSSARSHRG